MQCKASGKRRISDCGTTPTRMWAWFAESNLTTSRKKQNKWRQTHLPVERRSWPPSRPPAGQRPRPVLRATSWRTLPTRCTRPGDGRGTEERAARRHVNPTFSAIELCHAVSVSAAHCTFVNTHLVLDFSHNVQVGQTWFNHQHVGAFSHVSLLQDTSRWKHRNTRF